MKAHVSTLIVLLGLALGTDTVRSAELYWNGSVSTDWNNQTNWIPQQVPSASDHVIIDSGSVTIPAEGVFAIMDFTGGVIFGPLTITSNAVLNWSGGATVGALTVASNAVLNFTGSDDKNIEGPLTNAGTVVWAGSGVLYVVNNGSPFNGLIENLAGALWDIQNDSSLLHFFNGNLYFRNAGTVRKSAGSGTTDIEIPFYNTGAIEADTGTIDFRGGGTVAGALSAGAGANITFSAGSFGSPGAALSGLGSIALTGGGLTLSNNVITNLQLLLGTLTLGPDFQGGTITNLSLSPGLVLAGNYTVSGTFNWSGGATAGALTVASNAVLNFTGSDEKDIEGPLTNAGTVVWAGSGVLYVVNNGSSVTGLIENLPGALWDIKNDTSLLPFFNGNLYFRNAGTVRKSAGSGTTDVEIPFYNTGVIEADTGTIDFRGGGTVAGALSAGAGANITFSAGSFGSPGAALSGLGSIALTGGGLTLSNNVITNLQLLLGTLTLGPDFQGGTITNLSLSPGLVLAGNYTVSGTFNWSGGATAGALTVASNAVLNFTGSDEKDIEGPLTNAGTVVWAGSGVLYVVNNGSSVTGLIENLPGALWDIKNDTSLLPFFNGNLYFRNAGTVRKSAGSGTTDVEIPFYNTGVIEADTGTIDFRGGGTVAGALSAGAGANITFSAGSFGSPGAALSGLGSIALTGGGLTLSNNVITNLQLLLGTLTLGPDFQGGTITNLSLSPGLVLAGNYTVSGTFNWSGGATAGALTVASNAVLNFTGSDEKDIEGPLTNAGTVVWAGSGVLYVVNNGSSVTGLIENLPGALWDIKNDTSLLPFFNGNLYFRNAGTVRKSAGSGTTDVEIPFYNTGVIEADTGTIDFRGGGTVAGALSAGAGANITFSAGSFGSPGAALSGLGSIALTGGGLTLSNNVITNLQLLLGTLTLGPDFQGGTITNLSLSPGLVLAGNYTVSGTFNWSGGATAGALTVASNAVLNFTGSDEKDIEGPLTNAGTVVWAGSGVLYVVNNGSSVTGLIENLPGALWDIKNDTSLLPYLNGASYFRNAGTVRKSAGSGTTDVEIPFYNTGAIEADTGTIDFQGGGTVVGTLSAGAGASITFSAGSFGSPGAALSGLGSIALTGGGLTLSNNVITNLQLLLGTLTLGPDFQGGTITNLSLSPGLVLAGNYTVSGTFNWSGGATAGALTVASNAVLNFTGSDEKDIEGPLTNAGTVVWAGSGVLYVVNNGSSVTGLIENLPGALWDIKNDTSLLPFFNGNLYFRNAGTVRKSAGSGTTDIEIPFYNTGVVAAQSGTLAFYGGYTETSSAVISISLGGANPGNGYGHIQFANAPNFLGTFNVSKRNGFLPSPGEVFDVLSFPSSTGAFSCLSLDLEDGLLMQPQFGRTGLKLTTTTYATGSSQPQLFISPSFNTLTVQWPLGFPGWVLQSSTNLSSPAWTPVSGTCGNQSVVPIAGGQQYFRLHNGN